MRRLFVLSALAVSVMIILAPTALASATAMFMGLGERTNPYDVSGDGSTVVGWVDSHTDPPTPPAAFRWTQGNGIESLGVQSGDGRSVSSDGSIVVGHDSNTAWRWTEVGGLESLDSPPLGGSTAPFKISGDGSTTVGRAGLPVLWTESGILELDPAPVGNYGQARGVSADGSVVVGWVEGSAGREAFIWTEDAGMVGLGFIPGDSQSQAAAVTPDGSVVVGYSDSRGSIPAILPRAFIDICIRNVLPSAWGRGHATEGKCQ